MFLYHAASDFSKTTAKEYGYANVIRAMFTHKKTLSHGLRKTDALNSRALTFSSCGSDETG